MVTYNVSILSLANIKFQTYEFMYFKQKAPTVGNIGFPYNAKLLSVKRGIILMKHSSPVYYVILPNHASIAKNILIQADITIIKLL